MLFSLQLMPQGAGRRVGTFLPRKTLHPPPMRFAWRGVSDTTLRERRELDPGTCCPDCGGDLRVVGEDACWAHLRRDFHDFWTSTKSEIAREALDRIGKLYDIERDINGQSADVRHAARQKLSHPKVTAFFAWSEQQLMRIPGKSDLAKAFRYGLSRRDAFSLFLTDGRVAIDNNPAERALRPIGIGRKNWLFAGADTGAETLARAMTIIETAKLNSLNPQAYLADVLDRIHDHKINRLDELLPWNWAPADAENRQAA